MTGNELVKKYYKIWRSFVNTEINEGTEKNSTKLLDRGFVFQFDENIKNVDILFIGINPSYNNEPEISKFYTKEQALQHSYFKAFKHIEDVLCKEYSRKISWTHTDLLVFRETSQAFIENRLLKKSQGADFIYQQLMVSKTIIEYYNPKIIVVSNTLARKLLGFERKKIKDKEYDIWMDYDFKFDKILGTQKIINNNKMNSVTFFTSMLTGQRALDNGSKQRLIWHIDYILNKS